MNAKHPHNATCDAFEAGESKNIIPNKYVAAQPDDKPVSTM